MFNRKLHWDHRFFLYWPSFYCLFTYLCWPTYLFCYLTPSLAVSFSLSLSLSASSACCSCAAHNCIQRAFNFSFSLPLSESLELDEVVLCWPGMAKNQGNMLPYLLLPLSLTLPLSLSLPPFVAYWVAQQMTIKVVTYTPRCPPPTPISCLLFPIPIELSCQAIGSFVGRFIITATSHLHLFTSFHSN